MSGSLINLTSLFPMVENIHVCISIPGYGQLRQLYMHNPSGIPRSRQKYEFWAIGMVLQPSNEVYPGLQ